MRVTAGLAGAAGFAAANFASAGALERQQSAAVRIAGPQSWSPLWQHAMASTARGLSGRHPANADEPTVSANAQTNAARQSLAIVLILVPVAGGVKSPLRPVVGSLETACMTGPREQRRQPGCPAQPCAMK